MKLTKIFSGIMALVMGAGLLAACSDSDDYYANTTPLLTDGAVVTGSADVTATTATVYGTVAGLDNVSAASYATGFYYGFAANALTETLTANSAGTFSSSIEGLNVGQTIYYQAFVTLQGRLTYKGEVKTLVTTDAVVTTGDASNVSFARATLSGSAAKYPDNAKTGFVIAASAEQEAVRAGLQLPATALDAFSVEKLGLLPSTTYYYAAYLDLGTSTIYGDVKQFTTTGNPLNADEEFVDLGLSVKWAKRNIGAENVTDFGGLFAFGDISGVNPSINPDDYASANTYKTAADLAYIATGGIGTLPTADLFEELFRLCTTEWTEQDGVKGYKVTGPNGNSIFLPAAGKRVENSISEEGAHGYYLTGSVNVNNPQYAVDYEFTSTSGVRNTRAVYEAMAVRAVSTARNVPFNKALLYGKWYLDNGQDGKQHVWEGPFTQWGKTDTWGTVTNGEPNPYQDIHWEMGKDQGWIGYTYGKDYGYMEFKEDGTVFIHRLDDNGNAIDENGTYTIDEARKTITIDINVLCANTWVAVKSGTLNILSLSEDGLQIGILNNDDYQYSLNYYSAAKADKDSGIKVQLNACGSDWVGVWDVVVGEFAPGEINGQHTFTYEGSAKDAMVFTLDFIGFSNKYPDAFVRIDEIKVDGKSIPFNANTFCYGDIEGKGNYRVELFNVYGMNTANGVVIASPFSNLTNTGSEPALGFSKTFEMTYTVVKEGVNRTYYPNLITINPSWGGPWDYNDGASFEVRLNPQTARYEVSSSNFNILFNSSWKNDKGESFSYGDGSIMTFIEIPDIFGFFPTMHCTLNSLKLDGQSVSFNAAGVLDTNEDNKYRLELWNMYGATSQTGSAFGTPNGGVIKELGFSNTMELGFTINSLFAVPQF